MQLSGSFLQSVLHLNRSHASHPIGGVRANPLSNATTFVYKETNIAPTAHQIFKNISLDDSVWGYVFVNL